MKKILIVLFLLFATNAMAANIYVDQNLVSDCTGDYSISSRNCSGSDGDAYTDDGSGNGIQDALDNMSGGDDIYLRGGTYTATSAGTCATWCIPKAADGSVDNYSSIQSYTGEWAVLDGNGQTCTNCDTRSTVLGCQGESDYFTTNYRIYWLIQRLEITGGVTTSGGAGIWMNGGPFTIRYCYIHDNKRSSGTGNNPAGLKSYQPRQSIVEYNWFDDNGGTINGEENQANIAFATDYNYCYEGCEVEDSCGSRGEDSFILERACTRNIIRYNYIDTSVTGFKHKSYQALTTVPSVITTYEDYGDIFHHNIFVNHTFSLMIKQDFAQAYNNIIIGSGTTGGIQSGQLWCGTCRDPVFMNVYNNTVIDGEIQLDVGYNAVDRCGIVSPITAFVPKWYVVNNIIAEFTNSAYYNSLAVGLRAGSGVGGATVDPTDLTIDRNLIYKASNPSWNSKPITVAWEAQDAYGGTFTTTEFDAQYGTENWESAEDNLFEGVSGSSQYKITSFDLGGGYSAPTAGLGGSHPYLSGVSIPSYIGAVNPNDESWVDGLIDDITSTTYLRATGVDPPSWVEGTNPPTLSSATIASNGTTLTLVFSENVSQGSGYSDSHIDIDSSSTGNDIGVTYVSGNGTTSHVYTIASTIQLEETVDIDFDGTADSLENSEDTDLAAITSTSVTNNSTQAEVIPDPSGNISGGVVSGVKFN